jgi:hypothetical protein
VIPQKFTLANFNLIHIFIFFLFKPKLTLGNCVSSTRKGRKEKKCVYYLFTVSFIKLKMRNCIADINFPSPQRIKPHTKDIKHSIPCQANLSQALVLFHLKKCNFLRFSEGETLIGKRNKNYYCLFVFLFVYLFVCPHLLMHTKENLLLSVTVVIGTLRQVDQWSIKHD